MRRSAGIRAWLPLCAPPRGTSVNTPQRPRILIADNHEGFRNELRDTLAREPDFQVVAAESNGADAVHSVRALRPHGLDVVLMDIDMPVMNGLDAGAHIAETDPDLPFIILTVFTIDRELFAAMDSGAVGFLNKNLSPASLVRTLRDFHRHGSAHVAHHGRPGTGLLAAGAGNAGCSAAEPGQQPIVARTGGPQAHRRRRTRQ
jgi:CheY-like chemotaxis protein